MTLTEGIEHIFFLGIGGIGMSGLARYFHRSSCGLTEDRPAAPDRVQTYHVCGYDRTPSALTKELEEEGIGIVYEDHPSVIAQWSLDPSNTLVVRTPAVPEDSAIYTYLREQGFTILKRAEVLGMITREKKALCVAGTHGKTTTSTMITHLMKGQKDDVRCTKGVNAFLGGIAMNYGTNVLIAPESEYVVVEADEYDRSFHQLRPYISVVTAVDADHLDIYGTEEAYREAFAHYTSLITGALVMKHGIALQPRLQEGVKCLTYGVVSHQTSDVSCQPDCYAENIRIVDAQIAFDYVSPLATIKDIELGVPVWVNIENAVAAITVALLVGVEAEQIKTQMASFKGVWRRFNIHVNTEKVVYIDDYAHHPQEIASTIASIRKLYPTRRLIGVFQPHLYTRTRDFAEDFRRVLSTLDECILLPIYPARELPIEGVTSEMLLTSEGTNELTNERVVEKADLIEVLRDDVRRTKEPMVVLTIGAGDIDRLVPAIAEALNC
ncbi:MAG: UDP-N-acetylmuramate--L-alanine ligase [Paludibacteraceae bacterium]|nr:UDP-N-acetylmuramate--L-alanine ligase [Paludibacteraceae bacterium]